MLELVGELLLMSVLLSRHLVHKILHLGKKLAAHVAHDDLQLGWGHVWAGMGTALRHVTVDPICPLLVGTREAWRGEKTKIQRC